MSEIAKVTTELDTPAFPIHIAHNDPSMEENIYWSEEVVC